MYINIIICRRGQRAFLLKMWNDTYCIIKRNSLSKWKNKRWMNNNEDLRCFLPCNDIISPRHIKGPCMSQFWPVNFRFFHLFLIHKDPGHDNRLHKIEYERKAPSHQIIFFCTSECMFVLMYVRPWGLKMNCSFEIFLV